jgi:hypothetical protein
MVRKTLPARRWNHDLTVDRVTGEINEYKVRFIDLHSYTVNGQQSEFIFSFRRFENSQMSKCTFSRPACALDLIGVFLSLRQIVGRLQAKPRLRATGIQSAPIDD